MVLRSGECSSMLTALVVVATVSSWASASSSPVGTVVWFAGETPPPGWLALNGQRISQADFPELFEFYRARNPHQVHNLTFNSSTIQIDDAMGLFVRSWDNGTRRDSDAATRVAGVAPGFNGNRVGTTQFDTFQAHSFSASNVMTRHGNQNWHTIGNAGPSYVTITDNRNAPQNDTFSYPVEYPWGAGAPRTSLETRPKNIAFLLIIRAMSVSPDDENRDRRLQDYNATLHSLNGSLANATSQQDLQARAIAVLEADYADLLTRFNALQNASDALLAAFANLSARVDLPSQTVSSNNSGSDEQNDNVPVATILTIVALILSVVSVVGFIILACRMQSPTRRNDQPRFHQAMVNPAYETN